MSSQVEQHSESVRDLAGTGDKLARDVQLASERLSRIRGSLAEARALGASTSRLETLLSAAFNELNKARDVLNTLHRDGQQYADTV